MLDDEATQIINTEENRELLLAQKAERARRKKEAKRRRKIRHRMKQCGLLLVIVLIIVAAVFLVRGCSGGSGSTEPPVGTWSCGVMTNYVFLEDGTGVLTSGLDSYPFTYRVGDGKLSVRFESDLVENCSYTFTVKKDVLTLIAGEGTYSPGTEYKLTRVKSGN